MNKTQNIRLLDIFVLGPFMIWSALQKDQPKWSQSWMLMAGIGTILYNWTSYQASR